MKRSDLLDLMIQEDSVRRRFVGYETELDRMNNLLTQLERLGMAPPEYLPEPKYCEVTGKQLECKPVRKWEKE